MRAKARQQVFNAVQAITGHALTEDELLEVQHAFEEDNPKGEFMVEYAVDESYNILANFQDIHKALDHYTRCKSNYDGLRLVERIV